MSVENLIKEALANLRNPATDSLSLVEQLLNQALAEPETDPRPQTQDSSKKQPGKFTKEIYDALTNGVGEKPYYRKEENQFNIYVADDQLICVVPFIEGPEGDYAEYIAKAICEAGLLIARLTAKQKFYISQWNQSDNARIKQTKRIEELKKALGDFGTHHATCDRSLFSLKLVHTGVCDCGLEQALKGD